MNFLHEIGQRLETMQMHIANPTHSSTRIEYTGRSESYCWYIYRIEFFHVGVFFLADSHSKKKKKSHSDADHTPRTDCPVRLAA